MRLSTIGVFAAQSLFLLMFLAAAPLEQLADAGAFGPAAPARDAAFAFAASWRHGMADNSPLYMPGFVALAAAAWIWSESYWSRQGVVWAILSLCAAIVTAQMTASHLAPMVVTAFERMSGLVAAAPAPPAHLAALQAGLYTLLTWTAFVIGSRLAIARQSLLPLAPVPLLTAGLVALRPFTVDDFMSTWGRRSIDGDPVAAGSLLAIPILAALLVARERRRGRGQRVQMARRLDLTG